MMDLSEYRSVPSREAYSALPPARGRFTFRYSKVGITLFGIGNGSLLIFFSSAYGISALKPVAVLMLLLAAYGTVSLLRRYSAAIHMPRALLALFFLSIIPYLRIVFEVLPTLETRKIIDGLLIFGPYYLLPFSALGIVAFVASTSVRFDAVVRHALPGIAVFVAMLALGGLVTIDPGQVAGVYSVYNNLAIPAAFLLFFPASRRNIVIGVIALGAILVLSTLQGSRSYLLVFFYLGLSTLLVGPYSGRVKFLFVTLLVLVFVLAGQVPIQNTLGGGGNTAIVEKLQLDTLLPLLEEIWQTGDLLALYFWQGNSRSGVVMDAFSGFTAWDYLWGRGVTATYESFVTRSTIEIGFMQEMFWLGLATVIPTFVYALTALLGFMRRRQWRHTAFGSAMIGIGLTRLLDGFIFGMPSLDLYKLLFWMFVMQSVLKNRYRQALFGRGST